MERDQEFLEYVVKSLADHADDVKVERKVDEMGVLLTLSVHGEDMGKIIGRQGNTAKAIRTLLRVIGMKNNSRVNLKIDEPEGYEKPERSEAPASAPVATPTPTVESANVDDAMADLEGI